LLPEIDILGSYEKRAAVKPPDTLEFEVARPITSREDAAAMARVHEYYCCDIADEWAAWLRFEGLPDTTSSIVKHAAYLHGARLWQFW
jgi:hypothetical protein